MLNKQVLILIFHDQFEYNVIKGSKLWPLTLNAMEEESWPR